MVHTPFLKLARFLTFQEIEWAWSWEWSTRCIFLDVKWEFFPCTWSRDLEEYLKNKEQKEQVNTETEIFQTPNHPPKKKRLHDISQWSTGPSLVHFQMNVEPLLPSNPIFRLFFLFVFGTLVIAFGSLHWLALGFLFLLYSLVILTSGPFRGWFPFAVTGTPLQSWVVGIGCMNCIPFL